MNKNIKPLNDLSYTDITNILEGYKIKYASMPNVKGDVNLETLLIRINPIYNQDVATLVHEFVHIYYEKHIGIHLHEELVEQTTIRYLNKNNGIFKVLNDYLDIRTQER